MSKSFWILEGGLPLISTWPLPLDLEVVLELVTVGAADKDTLTIQVGIQKGAGYEQPLFAKNSTLGYGPNEHGFGDYY